MKPKVTKTQRIAELERKLREAGAGQAHVYHFADAELHKASTDHLMASGVILTLTVLGGRKICDPVLIRNGLSLETVAALKADMVRSYHDAIEFKPKGAK
jgi:hypothetical protein